MSNGTTSALRPGTISIVATIANFAISKTPISLATRPVQPPYPINIMAVTKPTHRPVKGEQSSPRAQARGSLDGPHQRAGYARAYRVQNHCNTLRIQAH